MFSLNL